jgi:hypothetical protein
MQISGATLDMTAVRPVDSASRAQAAEQRAAEAPDTADVVNISPMAHARARLARAGHSEYVGFAEPVRQVVGEGDPNAELKARVLGLIVGVMVEHRIAARRAQAQHAARDAALDAQLEAARREAEAEAPPPPPLQQEPAGLRFPDASTSYDESDDGVLTVAGVVETIDGERIPFSANVAVDDSARGSINIPDAVDQMSVRARLPFNGTADELDQRRFRLTVSALSGDEAAIADRLRVWEHTDAGTSLAAVGVPGAGPVVVAGLAPLPAIDTAVDAADSTAA